MQTFDEAMAEWNKTEHVLATANVKINDMNKVYKAPFEHSDWAAYPQSPWPFIVLGIMDIRLEIEMLFSKN